MGCRQIKFLQELEEVVTIGKFNVRRNIYSTFIYYFMAIINQVNIHTYGLTVIYVTDKVSAFE